MAGNMTNPYLTKKAQEKRRLSIPVVAVCTIFGLGAASAGIDLFREGKTLSGVMAVLLLAALFTPVVRTFAHYRRSASARDTTRHAGGKPDLRSASNHAFLRQSAPKAQGARQRRLSAKPANQRG